MKKTNKENPITFFRKANEARQKTVKASLKKAQDGIQMNPMPTLPVKQVPSKLMENVEKRKKIGKDEYNSMMRSNAAEKRFYDKVKSEVTPGNTIGEFSPTYTESRERPDLRPSTWKNLSESGLYTTPNKKGYNPVPSNIEDTYYKKGGVKKRKKK
jgi:hypothetical protein